VTRGGVEPAAVRLLSQAHAYMFKYMGRVTHARKGKKIDTASVLIFFQTWCMYRHRGGRRTAFNPRPRRGRTVATPGM